MVFHWLKPGSVTFGIAVVMLFVAWAFAWWKGGRAERSAATLNISLGLLVTLASLALKREIRPMVELGIDAGLAIGFLVLAVRFAKLWLGVALMLQAIQFCLHAYYMNEELALDVTHTIVNNLDSIGIAACILVGTALQWRGNVRTRQTTAGQSG